MVLPAVAALAMVLAACGAANEGSARNQTAAGPGTSDSVAPAANPGNSSGQTANSDTTDPTAELAGSFKGAGASTQQVAQTAWIAAFTKANPKVTMNYDPIGSGGGRGKFIEGATAFGGTDEALNSKEIDQAQKRCQDGLIEFPVYISPIAIAYNLDGIKNLRLAPEALARIFTGDIKKWNDPAIAETNPDVTLPDQRITPVHRSDNSGTSFNFTDYLSQVAPKAWPYPAGGAWPSELQGEAAQGTSGVIQVTASTRGAITYADASQVADLGAADIKVGSEFVGPTAAAAAKIFSDSKQAEGRSKHVITFELNRKTEQSGTYPVVLASYELACSHYGSPDTAAMVKAYLTYIVSDKGQQLAAKESGSAPLPDDLRTSQLMPAIESIGS